ncbi:hypothetical protein [Mucilaginibacter endophyticus]|uniref:hypothetical protein n=1 Tax=Mucilaginibacter endophyticus TaxID=2675003 RepID=UPI000E0DBE4C|nr:hypothetical protein [Mucilaginibacter endophyticus]
MKMSSSKTNRRGRLCLALLIILTISQNIAFASICQPDTAKRSRTDTAGQKPTPYNPNPSDKTGRTLYDTGGNSGTIGKRDTTNTLATSSPGHVKDKTANDKYFELGAAILIAVVVIAIIIRGRKQQR